MEGISAHALEMLKRHSFLGNVRELENILERACLFMTGSVIEPESLDLGGTRPQMTQPSNSESVSGGNATLEEMERNAVVAALQRWDGNRTKAAAELGISRRTLFNKLKALGISDRTPGGT